MPEYRLNSLFTALGFGLGGLLLLLYNFGWLVSVAPWAQAGLGGVLAVAALGFFVAFFRVRTHWWRLIPAWTLLALAAMVFLNSGQADSPQSQLSGRLSAALLFAGLALAFAHVYLLDRAERWWAILPSGFMAVLGVVIAASGVLGSVETLGALLFAGLGGVFFLLYLLDSQGRHWWALIPASTLLLFGLFLFATGNRTDNESANNLSRWWPVLLILVAFFIGWRSTRRPPVTRLKVQNAPGPVGKRQKISPPARQERLGLGEYTRPAPGATIEILSDPDEK